MQAVALISMLEVEYIMFVWGRHGGGICTHKCRGFGAIYDLRSNRVFHQIDSNGRVSAFDL